MLGLRFLCLDGGLPPEFCGFGSLKVNSKVPPIVRVCGGTGLFAAVRQSGVGLSPRRRDLARISTGPWIQALAHPRAFGDGAFYPHARVRRS